MTKFDTIKTISILEKIIDEMYDIETSLYHRHFETWRRQDLPENLKNLLIQKEELKEDEAENWHKTRDAYYDFLEKEKKEDTVSQWLDFNQEFNKEYFRQLNEVNNKLDDEFLKRQKKLIELEEEFQINNYVAFKEWKAKSRL